MRVLGLGLDGVETIMPPGAIRLASDTFTHYFLPTAPTTPALLDRWTDTTTGITYTRFQGTWVELGPSYNLEFNVNPPENLTPPVASGGTHVGDTVSTTSGTWSITPTNITYQWQRLDSGIWVDIPQTNNTYDEIPVGTYRAVVTAFNGLASASATSNTLIITEETGSTFILDGPASTNASIPTPTQLQRNGTGTFATGWISTPITQKSYFEIRFQGTTESSILITGNDSMPVSTSENPVFLWNEPNAFIRHEQWSLGHRANYGMNINESVGTLISYDTATTDVVLRICVDPGARRFWITTAGRSLPGNPVLGSLPTFTLNGTSPIHIGLLVGASSTATIVPVNEHIGPMPASYVAI